MHLGDSIFIFILALVLFGPKKLPEMARQIGKLMAEFRRASNDFRSQIDEELRTMERQEREKKLEAERAAAAVAVSAPAPAAALPENATPSILPPATGAPVSTANPFAISAPAESASAPLPAVEDHPLLHVETIPHDPHAAATGPAAAEANAARLAYAPAAEPSVVTESEQAPLTHG
jgi:sec-independent protein translocase protein TatB